MKIRAALILDDLSICKWQRDALSDALDILDVQLVLNCTNTATKRKLDKHLFYYILNSLTLKNTESRKGPYDVTRESVVHFDADYQVLWQSFPLAILDRIKKDEIQVIIKFGMGLLKVPGDISDCPILSYHHGDPSKYRGRPAGFYEILNAEKKSGIIVQRLSNKLDAGTVYAYGEVKIISHSYKQTSLNFYSSSRHLLRRALINLKNNSPLELQATGKNYTLPSNVVVLRFCLRLLQARLKRILYGAFYEKRWRVAVSSVEIDFESSNNLDISGSTEIPISRGYKFYADPFFSMDGSVIRLEALDKKTGLGDILEISVSDLSSQKVILTGGHYSYPSSFIANGCAFLLPEVASHSPQYVYQLSEGVRSKIFIKGLEDHRIVDATMYEKDGCWYLFFGLNHNAHSVLHLWVCKDLKGEFKPHPVSPICLAPCSSRMGGNIVLHNKNVYRLGQNNEGGYGEALTISKVVEMTPQRYREIVCGSVQVNGFKGPHSLAINSANGTKVFDYYDDQFSLLSGLRRLRAKI